jgi:ankyrin repeat protein
MDSASSLFAAIAAHDLDSVSRLVTADPSLAVAKNEAGISALMFAAYHRQTEIVALICASGPQLDMCEAAAVGDTQRLRAILANRSLMVTRSNDGFTPLHFAAFFNHLEAAKLLLDAGADANAVADNPSRVQPLHSAAAARSADIARLLLEHGARSNAMQQGGWTALQSAAKHGDLALIDLLLAHGADPYQKADDGQTAVTMSANDEIRTRLTKTR